MAGRHRPLTGVVDIAPGLPSAAGWKKRLTGAGASELDALTELLPSFLALQLVIKHLRKLRSFLRLFEKPLGMMEVC